MATDQLTYNGKLEIVRCWCGIRVGMPSELNRAQARDPRKVAYCPLGHEFVRGGKSDEEERAERAEREATRLRSQLDQAQARAEHERRSAIALKGHLTRLRRRVANGVCPVPGCGRSFTRVMSHIAAKHPEWHAEHAHEIRAD